MYDDESGESRTVSTRATSRGERLLAEHETYIVTLARQKCPRSPGHPDRLADDIDELAQRVRIKLWLIAQKQDILAEKAYICCIATTVSADMVREQKPVLALPVNEEGEVYQDNLVLPLGHQEQDPAVLLAEEEGLNDCMEWMAEGVLDLPTVQQQAMLYSLKKRADDLFPFIEKLQERGADIQGANLPEDTNQQRSYRTSLSIARKKMRTWYSQYNAC